MKIKIKLNNGNYLTFSENLIVPDNHRATLKYREELLNQIITNTDCIQRIHREKHSKNYTIMPTIKHCDEIHVYDFLINNEFALKIFPISVLDYFEIDFKYSKDIKHALNSIYISVDDNENFINIENFIAICNITIDDSSSLTLDYSNYHNKKYYLKDELNSMLLVEYVKEQIKLIRIYLDEQ